MFTLYHDTLQMVSVNPLQKLLSRLYGLAIDFCLIFTLQVFIGRMTKIEDRYWIETDSFVHSSFPKKATSKMVLKVLPILTSVLHILKLHIIPVFHVLKCFPTHIPFVENLNLYILPNTLTFFVTYTQGFNMHTGQPNPTSIINEYISGKLVLNHSNNKYVFPALNVSNNFATIDYDAHINTKIDYTKTPLIMSFVL